MAKLSRNLSDFHRDFINKQQIFFVGTADVDGRINISPKGLDSLHIASPSKIYWLNLTGSGNETAAHILGCNRITLMFCSFKGSPLILRAYGTANIMQSANSDYRNIIKNFPEFTGIRQVFEINLDSVLTSCGFGVPLYDYVGQRSGLLNWSDKKGEEGIVQYQQQNNAISLDGKPTDIKEAI